MLQRVEKAIDQVGMLKFKDREPSRLSGGQKATSGYSRYYRLETNYYYP